jgi:hypothetical protein
MSPPGRQVARKRLPDLLAVRKRYEELAVVVAMAGIAEVPPIGVADRVDQSSFSDDSIGLLEPECRRTLIEEREERVVLGQRVGQLDNVADEERPEAAATTWLGLERV